jgi:uncharacterized protein
VFDWDARKAATNLRKHGISFEEAATVFADVFGLDAADLQHSATEPRWHRLGRSRIGRVLVVAYTVRRTLDGETIRIISARRANQKERAAYTSD